MSKNSIGSNIPIEVPFGTTGVSTLTSNSVLVGNGTNPVTTLSTSTNGATLIGASSATPAFNTITAGSNISIVNASNSITINYTGSSGGGVVTSWTPAIDITDPSWITFPTYTTQTGLYIKVGNLVTFTGFIQLLTTGTWVGSRGPTFAIVGLPFTHNSLITLGEFAGTINIRNTSSLSTINAYIQCQVAPNASSSVVPRFDNINFTQMNAHTNNSSFNFSGFTIIQ